MRGNERVRARSYVGQRQAVPYGVCHWVPGHRFIARGSSPPSARQWARTASTGPATVKPARPGPSPRNPAQPLPSNHTPETTRRNRRQYTVRELELLAKLAGLDQIALYGEMRMGVDLEHEDAYRMLALYRKP